MQVVVSQQDYSFSAVNGNQKRCGRSIGGNVPSQHAVSDFVSPRLVSTSARLKRLLEVLRIGPDHHLHKD